MAATSDNKPPTAASERDYLAEQARQAKEALRAGLSRLGADAGEVADPRRWARRHPWVTVGATAAAGFMAAYALVPSKEDRALKKIARIERALHPQPSDNGSADHHERGDPPRETFTSAITRQLISVIRPALLSFISAGMTAKGASDDSNHPDDDTDPLAPGEGI